MNNLALSPQDITAVDRVSTMERLDHLSIGEAPTACDEHGCEPLDELNYVVEGEHEHNCEERWAEMKLRKDRSTAAEPVRQPVS